MTYVILRPNSTILNSTIDISGGSDLDDVLADSGAPGLLTLGYVPDTRAWVDQFGAVGFPDPSIPAGAALTRFQVYVECQADNGPGFIRAIAFCGLYGGPDVAMIPAPGVGTIHLGEWGITSLPDDITGLFAMKTYAITNGAARLYSMYLRIFYATKPTTTVLQPAEGSTVQDTNTPEVRWSGAFDGEGGAGRAYQVKIFNYATYNGGGFNPETSTPTDSVSSPGSYAEKWTGSVRLPDNAVGEPYRAYVKVAQEIHGSLHWSDWDYNAFTIDVPNPGTPTIDAASDAANGRISLALAATAGDTDTTYYEVQVALSVNGPWMPVRGDYQDGQFTKVGASQTEYDHEASPGVVYYYRTRAIHDFGAGFLSYSAWSTISSDWWAIGTAQNDYWLKNPVYPSLNMKVRLASFEEVQREGRQYLLQPLGAAKPIALTDSRGGPTGTVKFRFDSETERDAFVATYETGQPLLLQGGSDNENFPERWIALGSYKSSRVVDRAAEGRTWDELAWSEVDRPNDLLGE